MSNIYTRVHNQKNSHENWSEINPVLLDGEIILVSIEGNIRMKVGDGVTSYNDLPFLDSDLRESLDSKISVSVSAADAGKILGIDENGNIVPIPLPESGGPTTWSTLKKLSWGDLKDLTS